MIFISPSSLLQSIHPVITIDYFYTLVSPHFTLYSSYPNKISSYHIMHPCQLWMDNNSACSLYTDSQTNDVYEWKRLFFLFSVSKVGRRKGAGAFVPFFNLFVFEIWILFGEFLPHKMELSWLSIFIRNATKFR